MFESSFSDKGIFYGRLKGFCQLIVQDFKVTDHASEKRETPVVPG